MNEYVLTTKKKIKNMKEQNYQEGFTLIDAYSDFYLPVIFNHEESLICDENSPRFGISVPLCAIIR